MVIQKLRSVASSIDEDGVVSSIRVTYLVTGIAPTASASEVLREVYNNTPPTVGASKRSNTELREIGNGTAEVEITYTPDSSYMAVGTSRSKADRQAGDEVWTFSTTGGQRHISRAYERNLYRGGAPSPGNPGFDINWNGRDGVFREAAGLDIHAPQLRETCVATMLADEVTTKYKQMVAELSCCFNKYKFHGWQEGEVLYLGADISAPYLNSSRDYLVDVTHQFAIARNETNVKILDGLVIPQVYGWDYVWVTPQTAVDLASLKYAVVSRVYKYADLRLLGVGTVTEQRSGKLIDDTEEEKF